MLASFVKSQSSLRAVLGKSTFNYRKFSSASSAFEEAKKKLNTLSEEPGNDVKLKLYGLFKQGTMGSCNAPKPGAFDFVGKAKWEAWNKLGSLSKDDAQKEYVKLVDSLAAASPAAAPAASASSTPQKYDGLTITVENGVRTIMLNRPPKKNAITWKMYADIPKALKEAAEDKNTVITVTTGAGDFYCSGNDLSNFTNIPSGQTPEDMAKMGKGVLEHFVGAFIDFPKPIIAVVNGPAIGVCVTIMAMYDGVIASDKATFHTPFSALGQSPEGCSSYIFPKIMGNAKANQFLLFNRKFSAKEAFDYGLVSEVVPHDKFHDTVNARLKEWAELPINSLVYSKKLIRERERAVLHQVNTAECELLQERWTSPDCMEAIMKFFSRKSKM